MFLQHYFSLQQAMSHLVLAKDRGSTGVVTLRNAYFDGQAGAAERQQRSSAVMSVSSMLCIAWSLVVSWQGAALGRVTLLGTVRRKFGNQGGGWAV